MNRPTAPLPFLRATALVVLLASVAAPVAGRGAGPARPTAPRKEAANRLIGAALTSRWGYTELADLCDRVGHRLSGSPEFDQAVAWAEAAMKKAGLANVRREPVMVPRWVRGEERAWIESPVRRELNILGLGMSVGTPPGGLTAEVAVVSNWSELAALGEAGVKGKIVLYDVPFTGYGPTVAYRWDGANRAARLGAVAVLLRSVGPVSLDTPHTGTLGYDDDVQKIPAAAVTIENATQIHRLVAAGERVTVHVEMGARQLDDVPGANVVGEIVGSEKPEEIVVVGGHLDSWDVGQGAQDDGVGCLISLDAARLIGELGLKPRRTIRVVFFANEENGLAGGRGYCEAHRAELARHVAAIETDTGNGPARGFDVSVRPMAGGPDSLRTAARSRESATRVIDALRAWSWAFEPLNGGALEPGHGGADISPILEAGVLGFGVDHDATRYFDVHHTRADTFDKIDHPNMARNTAILALMTWILADSPERLLPWPGDLPPAPVPH